MSCKRTSQPELDVWYMRRGKRSEGYRCERCVVEVRLGSNSEVAARPH